MPMPAMSNYILYVISSLIYLFSLGQHFIQFHNNQDRHISIILLIDKETEKNGKKTEFPGHTVGK